MGTRKRRGKVGRPNSERPKVLATFPKVQVPRSHNHHLPLVPWGSTSSFLTRIVLLHNVQIRLQRSISCIVVVSCPHENCAISILAHMLLHNQTILVQKSIEYIVVSCPAKCEYLLMFAKVFSIRTLYQQGLQYRFLLAFIEIHYGNDRFLCNIIISQQFWGFVLSLRLSFYKTPPKHFISLLIRPS